jgi:hypothetical protein
MRALSRRFVSFPLLPMAMRSACLSLGQRSFKAAAARKKRWRRAKSSSHGRFVLVLSQGRSGSTLILRMLNASPGVHICGENNKAFDHLKGFVESYRAAERNHSSYFFKLAWMLPCDQTILLARVRELVRAVYNPDGDRRVFGFKEIRYGRDGALDAELAFLRELFPDLKVVFNVRRTEDCVKSLFFSDNPIESAKLLEKTRASFWDYYSRHPEDCYWMPYEELRRGSAVLQGMFDFLQTPMTPAAETELNIRLRE